MNELESPRDPTDAAPGATSGARTARFAAPRWRAPGWGPTRIRGKLIILHTTFSLALAVALLLALHPPVKRLVLESESRACRLALEFYAAAPEQAARMATDGSGFAQGSAAELRLDPETADVARAEPGKMVIEGDEIGAISAVRWDAERGVFQQASVRISEAHAAVNRLYLILTIALLAVYALIALTLEVVVLPKQVYDPIETLRRADEAVQAGDRDQELIRETSIPRDEIGQIMRSRNQSIVKLRAQEEALEEALGRLEVVASELKRKNHLLEMARRNLADQDRLASLGMMSAGIAHELNTPLAVIKGCVEELEAREGRGLSPERVALMGRVVRRLEKLSESLLDFARARAPAFETVIVREVVEEAWTLVSLDRDAARVALDNQIDPDVRLTADGDRLTQVFVNLLRNAVDAIEGAGRIVVSAESAERDSREWVSITVADSGPGIDPVLFPRMFEPFASTRLDSHGTGLGLAVAEGIVREHGGLLLARNATPPEQGAVFEVMLPRVGGGSPGLFGQEAEAHKGSDHAATLPRRVDADHPSDANGASA
jgi:signal transduction histidine kinase